MRCGCLWNCSRWRGHPSRCPAGGSIRRDAHQEGVVIHTPIGQEGGAWVDQRSVALISDPEVHHLPIGSGADGVDHPTRVGSKTVVDGGDGFEDGHRVRCGLLWNCSRWRGQESTPLGRAPPANRAGAGSAVEVQVCQLSSTIPVDARLRHCLPIIVWAVGVELRAPLCHVGAHPDRLAGGEIGCHAQECHRIGCGCLWYCSRSGDAPHQRRGDPSL